MKRGLLEVDSLGQHSQTRLLVQIGSLAGAQRGACDPLEATEQLERPPEKLDRS